MKDIQDVEWDLEAFQDLETDAETKTLIRAVVEHKLQSDKSIDFIKGKGTGLIILLHGYAILSILPISETMGADMIPEDQVPGRHLLQKGMFTLKFMLKLFR